jgi:hypothetical protein
MPKIQFDPRSNTKNGLPRQEAYTKGQGASLVARTKAGNNRDGGGMQFRIEDGNHAKKMEPR